MPLNAKDFGAVGNDSADDTTALDNAVAAAIVQKRALYIPAGTYRRTTPLDLRSRGLRVYGHTRETTIIKQVTENTAVIQLGRQQQQLAPLRRFRILLALDVSSVT